MYLGWAGSRTKAAARAAAVVNGISSIPGARSLLTGIARRATSGPTGMGPDEQQREGGISIAVAEARVDGPTPYELTADLLAWAATRLAAQVPAATGALGPADAFGLDALVEGCRGIGLTEVT